MKKSIKILLTRPEQPTSMVDSFCMLTELPTNSHLSIKTDKLEIARDRIDINETT